MPSRSLAVRIGHWSAQHRRIAVFGWLGLFVVSIALAATVGMTTLKSEELGDGESKQGDQILADGGFNDRASEQVLVQARDGGPSARDDAFRAAVSDVMQRLHRFDTVTEIENPYLPKNAGQVSKDGRSAIVGFEIVGDEDVVTDRVVPVEAAVAAAQEAHPALRIEQFGDASVERAVDKSFEEDFQKAETLSLPITLLILIVAFGAIVAAGLPLLLGISAVAITIGLLAPISSAVPVDESISSVILLVGLAVGIDYCLFYIRRERDERAAGRDNEAALEVAAATSGRAVLVSGVTVIVALAGMFLTGNATFTSFGTGTILVVAVAMVGSVTVLPALLSKLGDNIDRGRIPFIGRRRAARDPETGFWARVVDAVLHRPVVSVVLAGALLVALALPALRMHTVNSGVEGLPKDLAVIKTYERIQAAFPGGPLPAVVAVRADNVRSPKVAEQIRNLRDSAVATGLMREPVTTSYNEDLTVARVDIPVIGNGTDADSDRALAALRDKVVPSTVGTLDGTEAKVTGITAQSRDFNDLMKERAPIVFAFVLSLAFLLLMVTFRSIVIALKAVVLNLLSVGAAYGVLVLVFQDGRLESLLGFESIGGITAWLPLFLFVILFGLSMDYHVFILSRVREGRDRGMSTDDAISHGIKATASVVTSAAIVMVAVFAIFATLRSIDLKMMGVGLAAAVLIDATIVRAVLLPASMKLLGDWNWYLPSWLDWLPRVASEPAAATPAAPVAPAAAAAAPLAIETLRSAEETRVVLTGDLDLATVPLLRERLAAVEGEAELLVVDLRAVTFVDSSGLGELVAAHQRARRRQGRLVVLRGAGTRVAEVLAMSGLEGLLAGDGGARDG
ncbi:MAG TPA: MMPL family transporter [Solirubrobacteraceae bacterium]|jgi:RND superfamily putative drug exporter